jgi:hypothetical protein
VSGRLTDFICTTCSTVCFAHASCFYSFFWLLCRRASIANGVRLSEIDMELTSQTVVFAFFVCQKRGGYCSSSLGDCGARQELSHGVLHDVEYRFLGEPAMVLGK